MKYHGVIFDLNGILGDTVDDPAGNINGAPAEEGCAPVPAGAGRITGSPGELPELP
ncbi:MAG: hypothetical protein LBD31_06445 [Treponema sp.]|nr:hypothetical protein [Treponema sp.]